MSTSSARGRRRGVRLGWQAAALAAAVSVALVLAGQTSGAVFTAQTANGSDQLSAAASFCASPGSTTLTPAIDDATYQANPTTNYGTNAVLGTISGVGVNARSFLRFPLPSLGAFCTVTAATLRLYVNTPVGGRTIDVYQVDPAAPAWTELGLSWSNQPAATGAAASTTSPSVATWAQWTVTSQVAAIYAAARDNGLLVRDRNEGSASTMTQYFDSRDGTNKPQLLLTWG